MFFVASSSSFSGSGGVGGTSTVEMYCAPRQARDTRVSPRLAHACYVIYQAAPSRSYQASYRTCEMTSATGITRYACAASQPMGGAPSALSGHSQEMPPVLPGKGT